MVACLFVTTNTSINQTLRSPVQSVSQSIPPSTHPASYVVIHALAYGFTHLFVHLQKASKAFGMRFFFFFLRLKYINVYSVMHSFSPFYFLFFPLLWSVLSLIHPLISEHSHSFSRSKIRKAAGFHSYKQFHVSAELHTSFLFHETVANVTARLEVLRCRYLLYITKS